jgi:hypothetical protein
LFINYKPIPITLDREIIALLLYGSEEKHCPTSKWTVFAKSAADIFLAPGL